MLQSDANKLNKNLTVNYIQSISLEAISKIEKDLDPRDVISLVFLLYDSPNVALERLILYQRVYGDPNININLLSNWAKHNLNSSSWRYQFLEALGICQLFNIIRKLGFNVSSIKQSFMPNYFNVERYINPMNKALYKLCELMTSRNLQRLQNTLKTYNIKTTNTKFAEITILELICSKFIVIEQLGTEFKFDIDKLAKILEAFPDVQVKHHAMMLRQIQNRYNPSEPVATSTQLSASEPESEDKVTAHAFKFLEDEIDKIVNGFAAKNLKTDTNHSQEGVYPIKNPDRVGVCHIINQEEFLLPNDDVTNGFISTKILEPRLGSSKDKDLLESTMASLNFEVICDKNLDHKQTIEHIESIVKYRIQPDHSIYMLCILSHGIQGHVYAADSVAINVESIKNLLDKSFEKRQLVIPKILILQACRIKDEVQYAVASDGPSLHRLPKLHFVVCWATAPELEAYRDEIRGSFFIQIFCAVIRSLAQKEDLLQIFTYVIERITNICTYLKITQIPQAEFTLTKKLYLQIPK